ncbi:MAG TPA: type I DNA topoisomerase [Acidimicrobiia bacterium]|nr:type I DNA topoisomerase [Acidimicrobiia bacterium]
MPKPSPVPKPLVIVESKTKADTISRFLGPDYTVLASYGHVRDLPRKGLGVKVDDHFELTYAPPDGRAKEVVTKLRRALKDADELYLATDEDREGEAIAWHLLEVLKPKQTVAVKRMVFHEITRAAIDAAIASPRGLDMRLVEAQEGRRALDRLVGYEVSPVLWRRVGGARSAGRVQSVAVRLVVERERERMAFRSAEFWDLDGRFSSIGSAFDARLVELDGQRLANGRDFDAATGMLDPTSGARHLREADARPLAERVRGATFLVEAVEARDFTDRPKPPFKTTTLQQEAGNKLRFSAGRTMSVAQGLYERGFITYMRTDSVSLSGQAVGAARAQIAERFGDAYLPSSPRTYANKTKNAQEAHEAIRPAGDRFRTPEAVRTELSRDERAVYELIWMRTVASQMTDARGRRVTLRLGGDSSDGEHVVFRATGRSYEFLGFRKAYVDVSESPADRDDADAVLPAVARGDELECHGIEAVGHVTQSPPRYTEATLVKVLEDSGIGRPSTYASIINTITSERGYVWKKANALVPSWTAFAKTQLLERHFAHLVDYGFTATMEEALDAVAAGQAESEKWLHSFYFGNGTVGLRELVSEEHLAQIDMSEVNAIRIGADDSGAEIIVRVWNNGESLHRGDEKAPLPADLPPDELTVARALEILAKGAGGPRDLGIDPESDQKVLVLTGRFGPFVQLGELEDGSKAKPPRASLFASMDPDTVTLDDAMRLLSLPRVVGVVDDDVEITAQNGRYGPYLKKGTDSRSLESEEQLFTVTMEQAEAIFALPKQRGGRRAKPPIAELGPHPESGAPLRVLDGRFGPYVTDGSTNATVRRGLDPAALTLEEAVDLLAERAARAPAKKKAKKKATKKKIVKQATKKKIVKQATKKAVKKAVKNAVKKVPAE